MNHNLNTIPGSLICGNILLTTVGGHRVFTSILVEVKVLAANGQDTVGDWVSTKATIVPGFANRSRCSGPMLRRNLFTATAPSHVGNGNLYVGVRKSHVVRALPAQ